jgi:uncharacterized protein (DUF433 family)
MNKLLLLIILAVLTVTVSRGQNIYYDALKIAELKPSIAGGRVNIPNNNAVYKVLRNYTLDKDSTKILIGEAFENNPFIKVQKPAGGNGISKSNITQTIGGLDVTKYANAISELMIKRAKQELTIAFFNRFKKFSEENPEFKILFPKTTDNLANLLTYTYPQMLPALRNSFFEDIKQITYHLDDVLQLPKYQDLLKNFPEVRVAIRSINLMHKLETKTATAADIIKDFSKFEELTDTVKVKNYSKEFKNFGASVKLGAIFSESLREPDTLKNTIWIKMSQAQKMLNDKVFFTIYMGLIYHQCKNENITFYLKDNKTLDFADGVLKEQKDNLLIFQSKIIEMITLGNNVSETLKDFKDKEKKKEKLSNDDIYNYINLSIDVIDYSQSIAKIFNEELVSDSYLLIAKKSNALYRDIYSEEYTQSVNDAVEILKNIHYLVENNTQGKNQKDKLEELLTFAEKVRPYALFMGNMVEAKTEDQVMAALDNAMLPVGSSTIKKYTKDWGNISIQSYLGAYYSFSSLSTAIPNAWSDEFGVIAPIGISWTPGFLSWKRGGSLSIFASFIDLGAIVDYQLKQEDRTNNSGSTEEVIVKDYNIELAQIFSPGGYLVYGFPWNLPLSIGIGGQYGPGLSKIDAGGNTVITNPSWRWNAFLAVDIPFFNLMNHNNDTPINSKKNKKAK